MWKEILKRLFDTGKINEERIRNAVTKGLISDEECVEIIGVYVLEPEPVIEPEPMSELEINSDLLSETSSETVEELTETEEEGNQT